LLKPLITDFPPYEYLGCFASANSTGGTRLIGSNSIKFNGNNTHQACSDYCTSATNPAPGGPYTYFGLEFGVNCRCSNGFAYDNPANGTSCNTPASGNITEAAGGAEQISVWRARNITPPPPPPATVRPLSHCSVHKCSVLCKRFLLSHQGQYQVSTTALRPSHSIRHGGILQVIMGHHIPHTTSLSSNHIDQQRQRRRTWDLQRNQMVSTPSPLLNI
jgi:hypothetical protein